ncbi:hypothetical protein [Verrucomicrobium spinosum]|uniref:hypothetical protein n=1 Tax=Verrucomicrobium spinosum TaxID=2736 RepID=UPI0009467522|nr:hypothetical protein [Verrucomicrobium spinosum]
MNPPEPLPKKKRRLRRFLLGSLVFLLLLAGGVWLGRQWIGDILAAEANSRLADAGVFMSWEDANWVPGPGVSLTNVTLYRDAAKTDAAVKVSHLRLVKDSPAGATGTREGSPPGNPTWNCWRARHACRWRTSAST